MYYINKTYLYSKKNIAGFEILDKDDSDFRILLHYDEAIEFIKNQGGKIYNAEIYESYNEQGLKDIDSTPGNKAQDEDDMSTADVIFSIVTGKIIMYTTIILGIVAILGFGVFEIKKRVLKKKNK